MRTRFIALCLAAAAAPALAAPAGAAGPTAPASGPYQQQAVVTDIRVGEHATYDRIVVQFRRAFPGYDARYVKVLRQDGSGARVQLKGRKNIQIRLEPARAHTAAGTPSLPSLGQVVRLPQIREWQVIGDFEGVVTIGVGVRHRRDISVDLLRHPRRLVFDIDH